MTSPHILRPVLDNAQNITYGGGGAAVLFWGLHVSDIAVILSSLASVCGVALQFYVALHRIRRLEKGLEANNIVTEAQAKAVRVLDTKIEETK